jgi:hypothetical protein
MKWKGGSIISSKGQQSVDSNEEAKHARNSWRVEKQELESIGRIFRSG